MRYLLIPAVALCVSSQLNAQPAYDYSKPFLATSQLGFRTQSVKRIVLIPGNGKEKLPDEIPFYITLVGSRMQRETTAPEQWKNTIFRWPFEIDKGKYLPWKSDSVPFLFEGKLTRKTSRWGICWMGTFSDFNAPGLYQIETTYGCTVPFMVDDQLYDRLDRSYLEYMSCQRSGVEVPGIRPVENADDGRLMSDPSSYLPVAGGWNDAGDWRKWMSLTLGNLEALIRIYESGHPGFRNQALEEIRWGNAYFHNMISDSGFVYEDTGGGFNRAQGMDDAWWNENHPGVNAGGDLQADNIPMNGNERSVRDHYNPLVQFMFVRYQALCASTLPNPDKSNCRVLAERAWKYGKSRQHDGRTLFVSEELLAAMELLHAGSMSVNPREAGRLIDTLLSRQATFNHGITGFYMENGFADGFRSIAFPAEPALALLRVLEVKHPGLQAFQDRIEKSLKSYIDDYLIADSRSNPFGIPPYGVYCHPPSPELQKFRDAGNGNYIRTFLHVFSDRPMPHGVNANFLGQASLAARAGNYFKRADWLDFAEGILQWSTGFNNTGLCLFTGVGFKHPVPANFVNYKIPSGVSVGFLGRPDDTPYLETSNAIEWSTQEIWDVPFYNTIQLIYLLKNKDF